MMEQTTTWLCPVCDKVLNVEELIIDGYAFLRLMVQSIFHRYLYRYFDRIVKETPESVEDVMVEADGEWHTSDNKYASAGWRATHPISTGTKPVKSASPRKEPERPVASSSNSANFINSRPQQEVISLDSDSDEEGIVKRELSPTSGYATPPQLQSQNTNRGKSGRVPLPVVSTSSISNDVIDLTLDSDEEDARPPPPPRPTAKRKEREADVAGEAAWKRSRYAGPSASGSAPSGGYANGVGGSNSAGERGMNGSSYPSAAGASGSGAATSWGSVRTQTSAHTQSVYQAPYSHAAPSTLGMPVHSQNLNALYANFGSSRPRPMDTTLPAPPVPAHSASFHGVHPPAP